MDKIIIKGLQLFAYHGVNPEEKENGQLFLLDIACACDLREAGRSDALNDTVSYSQIVKSVTAVFTAQKYDLLERAAQVAADCILDAYPPVLSVRVLLKKPDAPIGAEFDYVAVEIERERERR